MKKLALTAVIGLVLFPSVTFASTDAQIQSSLTQQLLSMFVVEVNSLDKIQSLVSQSSNPSQFDNFSALVASQLSQTTAQLATLLDASSTPEITNIVSQSVTPPADLSQIILSLNNIPTLNGAAVFHIQVKDSNGNTIDHPTVQINTTLNGNPYGRTGTVNGFTSTETTTDSSYPWGYSQSFGKDDAGFNFNPLLTESGTYTFTFTANGLSTSTQITL